MKHGLDHTRIFSMKDEAKFWRCFDEYNDRLFDQWEREQQGFEDLTNNEKRDLKGEELQEKDSDESV